MDKISSLDTQRGSPTVDGPQKERESVQRNLTAKDGLFIATECHLALLPDEDGDTALHLAAVQGDLEACKKLVELFGIAGKSIDVRNKLLQTPLHVAVITNNKDIVKLLVISGSDPDHPDRYGSTAYHLCAKFDHHECFVEILENKRRPLSLNIRDYEGQTPLHVAVLHHAEKTFRLLISNGVDIDCKDNKGGRSALVYAIEKNEKGFVETLLEHDASVSQQTYSGDTALHIASGRGLQDIVRLLLRRGADANMKNTHFETPISLAASPVLSDLMRNQYRNIPTDKMMFQDSHSAYVPRHLPPHFLKIASDREGMVSKRSLSLKMETPTLESDGASLSKRLRMMDNSFPEQLLHGSTVNLPQRITVKREYVDPSVGNQTSMTMTKITEVQADPAEEDLESTKASDSFEEHVEIAMEEVEVSAEEEAATKSDDDDDKTNDTPSPIFNHNGIKPDHPYTHKLMQYSTNLMNKSSSTIVAKPLPNSMPSTSQDNYDGKNVAIGQEQIQTVNTLSNELHTKLRNVSVAQSLPSQPAIVKSKSVPNSPQPAEANLYQLAREGLAIAAMTNSVHAQQGSARDFGLSNYLKARSSRQAKIKSGTAELQNLALQGLAVAAMNGQSDILTANEDKRKTVDDIEIKRSPGLVLDFKNLSQPLTQRSDVPAPLLLRSNSMPLKAMGNSGAAAFKQQSFSGHLSSNRALLALAHANARKEHVGQAVSAISMGKAQLNGAAKFPSPQMMSDISDVTRQNLRQAIMVKNTPQANELNFHATIPAIEPVQNAHKGALEVRTPAKSSKSISIKFLSSATQSEITSSSMSVRALPIINGATAIESTGTKSLEPSAVFNITVTRNSQLDLNSTSNSSQLVTSSRTAPTSVFLPTDVALAAKITKDSAPTHTVAPLQIATNRNIPVMRSETGQLPSVISVATAPVVTYRVSTPVSASAQPAPLIRSSLSSDELMSAPHNIAHLATSSTGTGSSGSTIGGIPVSVSLGIQQHQILAQPALQMPQQSTSYVQPQIAYIPHGNDLIPIVLPPSALQTQLQYSCYPSLAMHPLQNTGDKSEANSNAHLPQAYVNSLSKIAAGGPSLLGSVPYSMPATQLRGLYPLPTPLFGTSPQLNMVQQQQLIRDAFLYHQQSLLTQGRLATSQPTVATAKPVAAVSAVPVLKSSQSDSAKQVAGDEQPLNLSIKSEEPRSNGDQPLNLMKSERAHEVSSRSSVIRSAIVEKTELQRKEPEDQRQVLTPSVVAAHHIEQARGVFIPPPVVINPSAVPTLSTNSAGLSALPMPPIHYVNGMPYIIGVPPPL